MNEWERVFLIHVDPHAKIFSHMKIKEMWCDLVAMIILDVLICIWSTTKPVELSCLISGRFWMFGTCLGCLRDILCDRRCVFRASDPVELSCLNARMFWTFRWCLGICMDARPRTSGIKPFGAGTFWIFSGRCWGIFLRFGVVCYALEPMDLSYLNAKTFWMFGGV